jgi:hypothetical protein
MPPELFMAGQVTTIPLARFEDRRLRVGLDIA